VNVKHGSANFGYEDRLALIITWKEDLTDRPNKLNTV